MASLFHEVNRTTLKDFLDEKADFYENPKFIVLDPIQVPHGFTQKQDIEIAAFLTATIAWGNRKSIINNANRLMALMDHAPSDFVVNHQQADLKRFEGFVHRTFNEIDVQFFLKSLQQLYKRSSSLESYFRSNNQKSNLQAGISAFKQEFFGIPHPKRTQKHLSDPLKNSAAKRLNMFLRWMVRGSAKGVDFGLWQGIKKSELSCPLDVHTGNVARKLGLLTRTQNDAKALQELDRSLRTLDPKDPVKYDFALFGLGVFEGF